VRLSTGIAGLDEILQGGFIPGRAYLLRGGPGTGKTTVGLHFLTAGQPTWEKPLFITMGESEEQIRKNAETIGLDLDGVTFLDLSPASTFFTEVQSYDIFAPAEVEREPTTQQIVTQVEALKPQRVFLDAMTQFRYLAVDAFQFRKQALSFLRFLITRGRPYCSPLKAAWRPLTTICSSWPTGSLPWHLRPRGAPSASVSFAAPISTADCTP